MNNNSHILIWQKERETDIHTSVRIYPVDAKRGSRTEQAARTDVIPAAVPSMVFSAKKSSTCIKQINGNPFFCVIN